MNEVKMLVRTLVAPGVANPSASEMHFVGALDRVDGVRPALAQSFGVEANRADDAASFEVQFESVMRSRDPRLIEAVIG